MNKLLLIMFLVWTPATSLAIPYYYSATGNISVDGTSKSVSGIVTISNTLSFSDRIGYDPMFSFEIESFSFNIQDEMNFSGNSGSLGLSLMSVQVNSLYDGWVPPSDWIQNADGWWVPRERGWDMHNDNNYWVEGYSPAFSFYDSSGVNYSPLEGMNFGILAPTILLYGEDLLTAGKHTPGRITLTQIPPVPEPSTFFLLGIGLTGLFWFGRKRKLKDLSS